MASLDEKDQRKRDKSLRQTIADLKAAMSNVEGFKRLRAISDEEWQAAQDRQRIDNA